MFQLNFVFLLMMSVGFTIIQTSLAQEDRIVAYWGYECVDARCVRVPVNDTNRATVVAMNACFLKCHKYGSLWPRPRTVGSWNNALLNLNLTSIKIGGSIPEQHRPYWDQSMERFNRIMDAKGGLNRVADGEVGLSIEINVETASLELNSGTNERYELDLSFNGSNESFARIRAVTYYGARHGLETLSQLIAYDGFTNHLKLLSGASIQDEPVYRHRGILVDTDRRYYPVSAIKKTLDVMAINKLNVFHWFMFDSQSFSLVLQSHPELALKGALSLPQVYTASDVKEIVDYGRVLGVRIIPEFNAPSRKAEGFQNSGLLTCYNAQPWGSYCFSPPCGQFDVTKPEVYDLLHDIYSEMDEMFDHPTEFHMGGFEVYGSCWNTSSSVRSWMTNRGWDLTEGDYVKLWGYFQERSLNIYRNVTNRAANRKLILYESSKTRAGVIDEYLSADDYIIQVWSARGPSSQVPHLLDRGYEIIISDRDELFLNSGVGNSYESGNNGVYIPWHRIYENHFRGIADGNRASQILGAEACSWSETNDAGTLDARLWPRASAFAERLWADPDTDFRDAEYRILIHREFLVRFGVQAESIEPEWCVRNPGDCPHIVEKVSNSVQNCIANFRTIVLLFVIFMSIYY